MVGAFGMGCRYVSLLKMTNKQIKKAIASRERKVAKYLARLAILQDQQARLDEKVCNLKVELYGLREQALGGPLLYSRRVK